MKAWIEMTATERAAAAAKGDAVLLMPVLRTYRDVAHALTRAVVECPLGYHDGQPVAGRATTNADVVAWLQRLAWISDAVEAIDVAAPSTAAQVEEVVASLKRAASEPVPPGAIRLTPLARVPQSAVDELAGALRDVPAGGASGDAPAWLVRLHRAACEVAGIGVRAAAAATTSGGEAISSFCSSCNAALMFSARQQGDGLCGPCHRKANGTQNLADRCRAAGIEPSLVLEILVSPEGRAAIAECVRRPPVRMSDGTWREPRPGSEAKVGDQVRYLDGTECGSVFDVGPGDDLWIRCQLRRFVVKQSEVEVVRWSGP